MTESECACPFCSLVASGRSRHYQDLFPDATGSEVLLEMDDFLLVPDIAPIAIGHALLVSTTHRGNLLDVWRGTSKRAVRLIRDYRAWCQTNDDMHLLVFEHGLGSITSEKSACIDHAHIHLLPCRLYPDELIQRYQLKDTGTDDIPQVGPTEQFLALGCGDGQMLFRKSRFFESQIFRRCLGRILNKQHWHWQDYIDLPDALRTREQFQQNRDSLESFLTQRA